MKPKASARINLLLLFIIICILFFLHFRRVQRQMFRHDTIENIRENEK